MRFYRLAETFAGLPLVTNVSATNGSLSLGFMAAPLLACQIQASTNLRNWQSIYSSNLPASASFQFRYAEPANQPARFYRLSQTPGL